MWTGSASGRARSAALLCISGTTCVCVLTGGRHVYAIAYMYDRVTRGVTVLAGARTAWWPRGAVTPGPHTPGMPLVVRECLRRTWCCSSCSCPLPPGLARWRRATGTRWSGQLCWSSTGRRWEGRQRNSVWWSGGGCIWGWSGVCGPSSGWAEALGRMGEGRQLRAWLVQGHRCRRPSALCHMPCATRSTAGSTTEFRSSGGMGGTGTQALTRTH